LYVNEVPHGDRNSWRRNARRAHNDERREPVSRDRVLRAAMALADERGIDALTMRVLAGRLGIEAASL